MPIPDVESIMLPFLQTLDDGKQHEINEIQEVLAKQFNLTDEEKNERILTGRRRFDVRVRWARTHLNKAGLLEGTARGRFLITTAGKNLLKNAPKKIGFRFLKTIPAFIEWERQSREPDDREMIEIGKAETPEENLEASILSLNRALAQDLLERIKKAAPSFFERLVVDLLVAMGYGSLDKAKIVGKSGDGGVDGVIWEDKLGLEAIYIQAKRHKDAPIGPDRIREFVGSLEGQRARKGVFLTTSTFTEAAVAYVSSLGKHKVALIDGKRLSHLMIDHDIGVKETARHSIKKLDTDYFEYT